MAELADAHGSGPCEGYFMGVRIHLSAPRKTKMQIFQWLMIFGNLHFCYYEININSEEF